MKFSRLDMELKVYVALFLIHCNYPVESTLDCETVKGCKICCLQVDLVVKDVNKRYRNAGFLNDRINEYIELSSTKKDGLTAYCTKKADTNARRKGPACDNRVKGNDGLHYTNTTFVLYKFTFNCTYTKPHHKPHFHGYFIVKALADPMINRTLYYIKDDEIAVRKHVTDIYYPGKKKDEIYSYTCYGSSQFKKICEEKRKGGQIFQLFSYFNYHNRRLWEAALDNKEDLFFYCEDDW